MENQEKKLFLLDAFALIFRAYFAFSNNPRINSKGLNTSAVFGFTNTLLEVLKKYKPTHWAVVFDTAAPTHRHEEFVEYKANREAMPEDLAASLPYIFRLVEALNIPAFAMDGFEADDVIGTLARQAEAEGFITFMMTPDKDYGQLVTDKTFILKPARAGDAAEILGPPEVCARFEVEQPMQVIDILGLMGDKVDNIPGIPGVGEKTAIQLIKTYHSVERMLEHAHELKGKLREKVESNRELAIQSKRLATIRCDVPVSFEADAIKVAPLNPDLVRELFAELEFRRLASQLLGEELPSAPKAGTAQMNLFDEGVEETPASARAEVAEPAMLKRLADYPHNFSMVKDPVAIQEMVQELLTKPAFAFDTETTDLDAINAELVGLSFSAEPGTGYWIPAPDSRTETIALLDLLKPLFFNEKVIKIGQNIKYDLTVLANYGIQIKGPLFDTMLAHYLLQPDMRHNMNVLAETYLHYSPVPIEALIGPKGKNQKSMREADPQLLADYAAEDAEVTFRLYEMFLPMLADEGNAKAMLSQVEMPLVPVLASMERQGVRIDEAALNAMSSQLQSDIQTVEQEILALAGTSFNVSSPRQLGEVLFDVLGIDPQAKKTKTGQYATSEDVLSKLAHKHPIIDKILDFRELQKLKSTYVDALPGMVNPATGKVHTSYNQAVAATGRLSSNNPNLQNIPIRTKRGKEIRRAFLPSAPNRVLLSADYSQVELRIIASLSGDQAMIDAFLQGVDIHAATASKVFGVSLESVTDEMRRKAKMVNFGIIYGISAFGLSERLNIPRKEAKEIIDNYFTQFSRLKAYMDDCIAQAREKGYVETILGRRRYLRDIHSANAVVRGFAERNAINAPIQGSAADVIKMAMIHIHKAMVADGLQSSMIMQVHDELVFDVEPEELAAVQSLVRFHMEHAVEMAVPLVVEMGIGNNWLDAH